MLPKQLLLLSAVCAAVALSQLAAMLPAAAADDRRSTRAALTEANRVRRAFFDLSASIEDVQGLLNRARGSTRRDPYRTRWLDDRCLKAAETMGRLRWASKRLEKAFARTEAVIADYATRTPEYSDSAKLDELERYLKSSELLSQVLADVRQNMLRMETAPAGGEECTWRELAARLDVINGTLETIAFLFSDMAQLMLNTGGNAWAPLQSERHNYYTSPPFSKK